MDLKRDVIQFKVSLKTVRPTVWRRIEIPARYTFWELHVAIQDAMGWMDYHLHAFRVRHPRGKVHEIGIPDEDAFEGESAFLAGWKVRVADYVGRVGARATYEYDFGDGWVHELRRSIRGRCTSMIRRSGGGSRSRRDRRPRIAGELCLQLAARRSEAACSLRSRAATIIDAPQLKLTLARRATRGRSG